MIRVFLTLLMIATGGASAQESSPAEATIRSGLYTTPTVATRLRLGLWATLDPVRLKDVELLYGYRLSDLCKATINTDKPTALVRADLEVRNLSLTDQSVVTQRFTCLGSPEIAKEPVWVVTPDKLSLPNSRTFVSLNPGQPIKPDFGKLAIDSDKNTIVTFPGGNTKEFSFPDFVSKLPRQ